MVTIVDYGMGNLGSIRNMLSRIGAESAITSRPEEIAAADKLILPGVGHFDEAMRNLRSSGMVEALNEAVMRNGRPILGICLGMQLLTRRSDEGTEPGLGWVDADTKRLPFENLRVPHMGWNLIERRQDHPLTQDLPSEPRFYFVHSYFVHPDRDENLLTSTVYGEPFASAIVRDNVLGTQFHPEKSHKFGMKLLANFVESL
jgi:glutamine amidotransferase